MKKLLVVMACVAGIGCFADTIEEKLQAKLEEAIENNRGYIAVQWAQALKDYRDSQNAVEQRKAAQTANKFLTVYDNLLSSAPAIMQAFLHYEANSPYGSSDELGMVKAMLGAACNLTERPLTADDTMPVAKEAVEADKRMKEIIDNYKTAK